jgi:hypothetical protein
MTAGGSNYPARCRAIRTQTSIGRVRSTIQLWAHVIFPLRLQLRCLSRQPISFETFVVFLKFRRGLAVRYRLPRCQRIESLSIGLVRDLLLGGPLRFDHLIFTFAAWPLLTPR